MLIVSFTIYGKVQSKYDRDSKDKKARSNKKKLSLFILLIIAVYVFLFDHFVFKNTEEARWLDVFLANFLLWLLLSLFDAVVIDLWILVHWRPKFLSRSDCCRCSFFQEKSPQCSLQQQTRQGYLRGHAQGERRVAGF